MVISRTLLTQLEEAAQIARGLTMDAVEEAKSGHLGLPLGCAEMGAALFGYLLRLHPSEPRWINRDRFILSAGHGSIFLYVWLYLSGFALDELSQFRKLGSNLPGHPEFTVTPGVECTTGPLGQGIGNAVGFAISEKMQIGRLPKGQKILDYHVVCLCGDGCLQEGVSHESCSLAGHLKLDNLILIYDANGVTLDGMLEKTQSEDVGKRFEAYGFFVQTVDGHDLKQFIEAYELAKNSTRPNLIIARTIIGRGIGEVAATPKAHGEGGIPFIKAAKKRLGLPSLPFYISESLKKFFHERRLQWKETYDLWLKEFRRERRSYGKKFPKLWEKKPGENIMDEVFFPHCERISTREAGGEILNALATKNSEIITGSADLFSSNRNYLFRGGDFDGNNFLGRNVAFGIREHAMGAILNGIAYDGVFRPTGATFLVFSDYLRPAIRIAAMARLAVIYIFTHDSIAIGPDGPTHQPVETLTALRSIPHLHVIRPADGEECVGAYAIAYARLDGPTALVLSRQDLPLLGLENSRAGTLKGAYIARRETLYPKVIVLASGSELGLVLEAAEEFQEHVRIVSVPCMEIFETQSEAYQQSVLPETCPLRLAVEAGISLPWYRYVGPKGKVISIDTFGLSASGKILQEYFGFSVERMGDEIRTLLEKA
ncbi:MAG: transketolase [Puniceicoccales bacterium]|jgi:transketolase|nr:transketolase [Puniceicoccales bacterium]